MKTNTWKNINRNSGQSFSQRASRLGKWAVLTLSAAVLVACGGGGGSSPAEVPNANNLAPANVKLLEVSSAALGQITASWLPATDDATPVSNLIYQLHASTDAAFTPSSSTKVFEGQALYQAVVNTGLTAGVKYTVKLVVVDGQGATTSSEGLSVTVANTSAIAVAGAKVTTLQDEQVANISGNQVTLQSGVSSVQAGQFIASAQGASGNGYLKKVESVTMTNGQTVLQTRDASVNEVVSDIKLSSSFKMAGVPKEITQTSQQAGLVRKMPTTQNPSQELAWAQTGFRYSTPNSTAKTPTGLPASWGQGMQAGLVQGAAIDKQGSWGRLYMPGSLTVAEGETADFNIHSYIIDTSDPLIGERRKICKIDFGAMKGVGDTSKPSAVSVVSGQGRVNNQDAYRPTHLIYPATLNAGTGTANPNPYTVNVTLYVEELGEDCSNQTLWDETVTLPLTIYVTNDSAALREKEALTSSFAGSGDFKINNDIDMSFQPTITFDAVMAGAKLSTARIQLDAAPLVEQTLRITASAQGTVDKTANILPVRKFYKVYVTPAGVPIVISGAYRIDMTIKGDVTGAIDATEKLTIGFEELSYGLEYANGQYQVINKRQPVYRLSVGGQGKAQANLEITLQPRLELSAYEAATGTVVLEPYMNAQAGVEGHVQLDTEVDFNSQQLNMAADADYRLTKATLGGGVRAKLGAELSVWDYTIAAWPAKGELKTYDLVEQKDFWSLPLLGATANAQTKHTSDSRAMAVQASASTVPNPLKTLFPSMDDTFVTWAKWTNPRIVPSLATDASSYSILADSAGTDTAWAVFNKPGIYTVRQGGYSSLGTWARQYVETTIEIKDDNNNGIPDWWEQRYSMTGSGVAIAAADPDGDGLTNLQEWQQGTDPKVSNGSGNTLSATPTTPTILQTVELWLTNAWSTIKTVVFSFVDGAANFVNKTATVTNGVSEKISGFFTKSGVQTVSANYYDANDNIIGSGTLNISVSPGTVTTTAEITQVINDNSTPNSPIPKNTSTTDSTPKITGTVSAALGSLEQLQVYDNGSGDPIGTATVAADKTWTLLLTTPLASGSHSLSAAVRHIGYSASGPSSALWSFTVQGSTSTSKLPHSGITASQCYYAGSNTLMTCSGVASDLNAQQDGHRAGINTMSYSAVGSYPLTSCVKDNVTGLIWEGKEASGTRAGGNTYTNYHSSYYGTQAQMDAATNAYGYVAWVNQNDPCPVAGYGPWRLPTADELQTIVDYSKPYPDPTINTTWFPNTPSSSYYWTSSPYVGISSYAWYVNFYYGYVSGNYRDYYGARVRLVRASQ
jgi:hypothetical protein